MDTWLANDASHDLAMAAERLCRYLPEHGWPVILELVRQAPSDDVLSRIAQTRGPLETLIARHGAAFIGRIETEARTNPRMKTCLGLVDIASNRMAPEVWTRLADASGRELRVRPHSVPEFLRKEDSNVENMLDWDPAPPLTEPPSATAQEIAAMWLAHGEAFWAWEAVSDLMREGDLDESWAVLLALVRRGSDDALGAIGAGPLEDWLDNHGERIINRVEQEAARDPRFRYCLSHVWRGDMNEALWERVIRARGDEPQRG